MNNYEKLAFYYDEMKSMSDEKRTFFETIFNSYKDAKILDCACGTGYDMEVFIRDGYNVFGSDISASMIEVARNKKIIGLKRLKIVSFEELDSYYETKFDCILCLSNSINEINVNPIKALLSMKSILKEDGCIIFDQGQTDASMKHPPKNVVIADNKNLKREFYMSYHEDIMKVTIIDEIRTTPNQTIETEIELKIRLYNDWVDILEQCHLDYQFFGDFNGSVYDKNKSKRLIIVARKKTKET